MSDKIRKIKKLLKNSIILNRDNALENNIAELIAFTWDKRVESTNMHNICKRIFDILISQYIDIYDLLNISIKTSEDLQRVYDDIKSIAKERKITLK